MLRFCILTALVGASVAFVPRLDADTLAALEGVGGPAPSGNQCSDQQLLHCQSKFNGDLGISGNLDWTMPWDFMYALQNLYVNNGTQGVINVCSAYRDFSQCLGAQYSMCISPLFFIQHGYDFSDSFTYPAILAGLHFQCGGGLETLLGSFKCIQHTYYTANSTVQQCIAQYQHDMAAQPQLSCQNAVTYLQCVRAPFNAACGAPASWYQCEKTRVGIAIHQPYCDPNQLRCYVNQPSNLGASAEHPSLQYADKQTAFQAAMLEIKKGSASKVYSDLARGDKAMKNPAQ